ncbi:LA_3696 family protein [Leptospira licerasiae]|uniref:LA_3696 family protein n=1 Tax=Leptospira licerasiae TaxID=447106 RepID=UPI00301A0A1E
MFRRIPRKLEEILGDEGANEFSDFINDSFAANKENVMELVSDRFENRLSEELNVFRSEYRTDLADLRAEFKSDIAELRAEVKEDIAELRVEMNEKISELRIEIHKLISAQTRWMLGAIIALTGIFSIIVKM